MSSNLPLRTLRIPALQRQCLFQRRRHRQSTRPFSTTAPQLFASTSPRLRGQGLGRQDKSMTKAAAKSQSGPAPRVNMEKAQQDVNALADDIGLLQDTVIRASIGKLPGPWSPQFWGYFWKVIKSKATGLYSRGAYKRCIYKKGMSSYLPIDLRNGGQLKAIAEKLYEQMYTNFANGDMHSVSRFLLPPLTRNFKARIEARGPLKMDWKLKKFHSARIVSHRASPLDEPNIDTAYRQVVVRLESTQQLSISQTGSGTDSTKGWTPHVSRSSSPKGLRWVPEEAMNKIMNESETMGLDFADNGVPKRVVEYLVMQRRVIKGKQENWKVWGFAQESTPEVIEEDEAYWRKTMAAQAEQA